MKTGGGPDRSFGINFQNFDDFFNCISRFVFVVFRVRVIFCSSLMDFLFRVLVLH